MTDVEHVMELVESYGWACIHHQQEDGSDTLAKMIGLRDEIRQAITGTCGASVPGEGIASCRDRPDGHTTACPLRTSPTSSTSAGAARRSGAPPPRRG